MKQFCQMLTFKLNNIMKKIENTQEIDSVLNFLSMHINNNGCTLSREFKLIDMTEYCQNYNDSSKMFLITSHSEIYFYTRKLGLVECEVKKGRKFIPEFLEISGDELYNALKKMIEVLDIANLVIMNLPNEDKEMELLTVGDSSIQCKNVTKTGNQQVEISFLVTTRSDEGTTKCYIVDEIYDNDIEYTIIRDDMKGNMDLEKEPFDCEWSRSIRDDRRLKNIPFLSPFQTIFSFVTREIAYRELKISMNNDFDWESIECMDFWLSEFLRGDEKDINWINIVVNTIGHECTALIQWFIIQSDYPESWSEISFDSIKRMAELLKK